jgi:hypothetical protein
MFSDTPGVRAPTTARVDLPPFIPVWCDPASRRRSSAETPTVCSVLNCGRTFAWSLISGGHVDVVRLGKRKTLVSTASLIAYIESNTRVA